MQKKKIERIGDLPTWFLLLAYHAGRADLERRLQRRRPAHGQSIDDWMRENSTVADAVIQLQGEIRHRSQSQGSWFLKNADFTAEQYVDHCGLIGLNINELAQKIFSRQKAAQ